MSPRQPKIIKVGKFSVSRRVIDEQPALARKLMRDIIIVRAEMSYVQDSIEYIGICDEFEPISELTPVPEYNITKNGYGRRLITKVTAAVPAAIAHNVEDVDEDDPEPMPRKRKRRFDDDDEEAEVTIVHGAKTGRVSSAAAAFEEVDPLIRAVDKVAGRKPEPTDHMLITREFIEGSRK
jgi:hypothetical protein